MWKSNQLVGASLLVGSISCVVSCVDPSAVEPELVYAVENRFEETRFRESDMYEVLHRLDECLVGTFALDHKNGERLNIQGIIGNVCEETLVFRVPDKSDPNVFLSHQGRQYRWCAVSWEWNNSWSTLELKGVRRTFLAAHLWKCEVGSKEHRISRFPLLGQSRGIGPKSSVITGLNPTTSGPIGPSSVMRTVRSF